jgi:hypothetical protein
MKVPSHIYINPHCDNWDITAYVDINNQPFRVKEWFLSQRHRSPRWLADLAGKRYTKEQAIGLTLIELGKKICRDFCTDKPIDPVLSGRSKAAEEVELGWKALHMQPGVPDKRRRKELCQCEPETNQVPCEYCALYEALKAAERLLAENGRLRGDFKEVANNPQSQREGG